ncbi:hypothetical protein Tco_0258871, partial [Tanacetum coccineum]
MAKICSIDSVVAKLVLAASVYVSWQERNLRIFKKKTRTKDQVSEAILASVRLKLLLFWFKKSRRVDWVAADWDLPRALINT